MTGSSAPVIALAALAVVSLGLKVAVETPIDLDRLQAPFMDSARSALSAAGFEVLPQDRNRAVGGVREGCLVWLGTSRPEGGDDALFRTIYGPGAQVGFWYRGRVTTDRPSFSALRDRYVARFSGVFGRAPAVYPVYLISYAPACQRGLLERLALDVPARIAD